MGQLTQVSLHEAASELCNKCGKSGKHCCNDAVKFCKVDVKHPTVPGQQTLLPAINFLHLPVIIFPVPSSATTSFVSYNDDHAPPDRSPLYIQYCSYRI
jgi:hypothetical protein